VTGCGLSCRFSKWSSQPKARDSSNTTQQQRQQQQQQQQQQKANGQQDNKRKQGEGSVAAAAAGAEQQQQQQQQQQSQQGEQPLKQQRLEKPGKLDGASAAMVVGMQVCVFGHLGWSGFVCVDVCCVVQGCWRVGFVGVLCSRVCA
jgi:hypothetical protein